MTNEIKEILNKLKDNNNYEVDCNDGSAYKELFANEIYSLLDYITNLQEERDRQTSALNDLYNFYHNFINKYNLQSFWNEYTNLTKRDDKEWK